MVAADQLDAVLPRTKSRRPAFTEGPAWEQAGHGWKPLHGSFQRLGYSIEWHDFDLSRDLDWSRSFHPSSVEVCLNLAGHGDVEADGKTVSFGEETCGYYAQKNATLKGRRRGGERHKFITVEYSRPFLKNLLSNEVGSSAARLAGLFLKAPIVSDAARMTQEQRQLALSLLDPPLPAGGHSLWYAGKVREIAAALFYRPAPEEELFCERRKRLNRERAQKVMAILKENLASPPSLEEIGRRVGCSHFYLSRIFTEENGKTITSCLRDLRMERAAEYLREGRFNVTQVALEVGYSSLSHFSAVFHETFGCCPGLYPLATPAQAAVKTSTK